MEGKNFNLKKSVKEEKESIVDSEYFEKNDDKISLGNPRLAKNKEIYGILSDPEFIKTFPGPSDFQYSLIRESLISSKENAINGVAYLKDYIKNSSNPLFCLTKLSQFLRTAIGGYKSFVNNKEQQEISEILEKGLNDISSDDETKYFLGVNLNPDIVFSRKKSFERQERNLTPVQISSKYFVQDNGFDPIPIFYHTDNAKEFNSLIEEQKRFFESVRPANRPELSKNANLEEMTEYKKKYLDSTINFSEIKKEIREKINNSTNRLKPEEIQKFFPTSNNIFELTQDPLMFEFRVFINPEIRSLIEREFGIDLKEIPIKEQVYFLTSITDRTNKTIRPVQRFARKFKGLGLRTFLSVEQGGIEMGDKILEIAEKLPENVAKKVFEKYSEIVDTTEEVSRYVFDKVKSEGESENLPTEQIKETLLKRGKDLLVSFNEQIRTCTEDECFEIGEKILEELMMIKKEVLLFASTFKALTKERGTKLGDLQDVSINITKDPEFIKKYKDQMEKIFLSNRKDYPQDLKNSSIEEFRDAMDNLDNREMYILKEREDVVAFMRFDQLPNGNLYAGSLNSRSEIRGMAVGGAMLREVLDEKAKTHNVEAVVYEKNPMFKRYVSDEYKFEIIGEVEDYHGTGQKMYKLLRRSEVYIPENLPT